MAEETEENTNTEEIPKKPRPVATILILLQACMALGAAGFAIWSLSNPPPPPVSKVELQERSISSVQDIVDQVKTVDLKEFQVTSRQGGSITTSIILEVSNPGIEAKVSERMPQIKDLITEILSDISPYELKDIQGKLAVKNKIRNSINELILPMVSKENQGIIREVYLVQLLVKR